MPGDQRTTQLLRRRQLRLMTKRRSEEHDQLIDMIDAAEELSGAERARLRANLDWMMAVAPDLALFRRHVNGLDDQSR